MNGRIGTKLRNLLDRRRTGRPDPRAAITRLFRNPPQLRLLARQLSRAGVSGRPLHILVHGMADGAEAVSLMLALDPARNPVDFRIEGRDLCREYVEDAKTFCYTRQHFPSRIDPRDFREYLWRRPFGGWSLRRRWRSFFHYAQGDVLAVPQDLVPGSFDLVTCQNLLINLRGAECEQAFSNVARLLRPGGLLAVGGGPLGYIHRFAFARGLLPVLEDVEAIHEAWEVQRAFWGNACRPYWALEPYDATHPEGPERYCTIFRRPESER